jgi:hypothetical protein
VGIGMESMRMGVFTVGTLTDFSEGNGWRRS